MRIRHWAIGLFLIVGFGFFTAILFLIGDRQKAFSRHIDFYTEFTNISGLANGAKVRVSGLDAGKLKKIVIPKRASGKFRLELEVEDKVRELIRKDSVVTIETEGIVGDKYLMIKKGSEEAAEARAGTTLPGKEPLDIGALMERGSGLLNDVHSSLGDIRGRVDIALDSITKTVNHGDDLIVSMKPNINKIAGDTSRITGKIDTLVTDLNAGKGTAGMLLKDPKTEEQIRASLSNIQHSTEGIDRTIADFRSRDLAAKTQVTLENVQAMSQQLNSTLKEALAQDNLGDDGATNLRQTLSNLNRTTTNLAEDSEALKHNFFFRGFFNKRGFYNLDQLTPTEYLAACARQKNAGTRKWLSASDLVQNGTDGEEELTEAGRRQIDSEIAPVIADLPDRVIVVEGYAIANSPNLRYAKSRRRADLVRRYLERRYHVRHSDLGIVPLDVPPESSGRDRWDGAAVTLFVSKTKK